MKSEKISLIFGSIAVSALIVGGLVYVLFRPTGILLFRWVEWLGLTDYVMIWRERAGTFREIFPDWFIYSLPNALWLYSMCVFLILVWKDRRQGLVWLMGCWLIAVLFEILQIVHVIPGNFSNIDLIFIIGAIGLSFITYCQLKHF